MKSKQTIVLISLCMCLVHAVTALPLMADPQAPPANSLREAREAAHEQSSSTTETDGGSLSISSRAETQSVSAELAEELAQRNVASGNILYPFSAVAETIHSHRRKRQTGTSNVVHADVCADIVSMANQNLPNDTQTPCPWNYTCSYDPDTFPHYILKARCLWNYCTYPCQNDISPATGRTIKNCVTYSTTYSFLQLSDGDVKSMTIDIGCSCRR